MLYENSIPQNDSDFRAHNEYMKESHQEMGAHLVKKEQQHRSKDMLDNLPTTNIRFMCIPRNRNYHYEADFILYEADFIFIIYCSHKELQEVILKLENDTVELSNWFAQNGMKSNEEKCHLLVFGGKEMEISTKVGSSIIEESKQEKLLGVVLDQKLNFKQHVNMVCTKASQKLHALARASTYMPKEKTRTVMRAFVMSKFSY